VLLIGMLADHELTGAARGGVIHGDGAERAR